MLCQQILLSQCSLPVERHKCAYGNVAESKLLCVGVATLLRKKYASVLRVLS